MKNYKYETLTLVLIEDNPGHIQLFRNRLRNENIVNPLIIFEDGRVALKEISKWEPNKSAILVLDLNLPLMHGSEIIRKIREERGAAMLPIIIVSTSMDEWEIKSCSNLGSQAQFLKPFKVEEFLNSIRNIGDEYLVAMSPAGRVILKKHLIKCENEPSLPII